MNERVLRRSGGRIRHRRARVMVTITVGLLLAPITVHAGGASSTSNIATADIISLTNAARKQRSLQPLKHDAALERAAHRKAQDILERQSLDHRSPTGDNPRGWLGTQSKRFDRLGENLAMGTLQSDVVVQLWMNSSGHRDNLLSRAYNHIGVAVLDGSMRGQQTTIVVQLLAHADRLESAVTSKPKTQSADQVKRPTVKAKTVSSQPKAKATTKRNAKAAKLAQKSQKKKQAQLVKHCWPKLLADRRLQPMLRIMREIGLSAHCAAWRRAGPLRP